MNLKMILIVLLLNCLAIAGISASASCVVTAVDGSALGSVSDQVVRNQNGDRVCTLAPFDYVVDRFGYSAGRLINGKIYFRDYDYVISRLANDKILNRHGNTIGITSGCSPAESAGAALCLVPRELLK